MTSEIKDIYPLSPIQSGLLFSTLSSLEPDVYVVQSVFELEGELDISILKQAWQVVSNHNTTLRTGFIWEDGQEAEQYVLEKLEVPFIFYDYSVLPEIDRENKLELLIKMDREKAYDLAKAPLYRVYLVKDHDKKHYLIWSQHHILIDGWSAPIILGDVLKAYSQINLGKSLILEHRPPYRNYIAWLQRQDLSKAEFFWKCYLASVKEPIHLNFKSMIEENKKKGYDVCSMTFSLEETKEIKKFAGLHLLTLNTMIQGAVGTILRAYTQQQEIVMGVTVSGRNIDLPGIEEMVGIFINTLPLKIAYKPEETNLSFLKNLQDQVQKLNEYAYAPLAQIQSWIGVNQSLFDVILIFENYPLDKGAHKVADSFTIRGVRAVEKTEYPLTILVAPGKQLCLSLTYQTAHFNEEIIQRFLNHIRQILQNILKDPFQHIDELSLLTKQEQYQLLFEWNDNKTDYPQDSCIHELFEEQVEKTPNNIAVVYEGQELSYKELNEKANQLGSYLRTLGVGPDVLVAIAVERSLEMIIGLLGILKAGGAYVPLDLSYPEERLQFILNDIKAPVLLTQSSLQSMFKSYPGTILTLDHDWVIIQQKLKTNLSSLSLPHHLAYVIYTSGTTGNPKGVMIEHGGVVNNSYAVVKHRGINIGSRVLQTASYVFDPFVLEFCSTLFTGATLFIINEIFRKDIYLIHNYCFNNKITHLLLTTKLAEEFLHLENSKLYLTHLIIVGEKLNSVKISKFHIINEYGPTENTVCTTQFLVKGYNKDIPIGTPIFNTRCYVLDAKLIPLPIGATGELYIGGVGLARGYLNRPDLTADRFIPNPFTIRDNDAKSKTQYLRLYRTGDLARYLPDGNIEYKGRIDDQVKIRGFRIELGEIENALNHYTDIEHSVVVSDGDDGNKHLVAYVVPTKEIRKQLSQETQFISSAKDTCSTLTGDIAPSMSEALRGHLSTTLPDYMIPAFFVYIDKIPLTSNGKIDRKSLPAPDLSLRLVTEQYVEPRNDVERELCNIWKDVLNVSQVGIYDNFFGIGGDSIISIQVVSRARLKGLYFSIKDIFSNPTIIELSKVTTKENTCGGIQAEQGLISGSVPLTPIQHWFFSAKLDDNNHFNQAVMLEVSSKVNADMINKAINLLIKHHDALRHRYTKDKQRKWTQACIEINQEFDTDIISISNSLSDKETLDKISDKSTSIHKQIDIENGPLIRTALFNCEDSNNQTLLIVIHHLVVDGVSWRILIEDLNRICEDILLDKNPTLPQKTHSYKQWAELLTEYASSNDIKKEYSYWNNLVINIKALPTDFENKHATVGDMITVQTSLTEQETDVMLHKVPNAYNTQVNDILLTALTLAIGDWSNFYEIFLSLEGHGREDISNDIDTSRTVGWFTTIFPVYLKIEEPNDIGESIKAIKEELRAIPNKGIGYGILAYLLDKAVLNSHDNPSISFNYLGQWDNVSLKDNLFMHSPKPSGQSVSPINKQSHLIDINAEIRNNKLDFFISYSNKHYKHQTIENIASLLSKRLRQLIDHCNQDNTIGYTPSDFDLIKSTKNKLDRKINTIKSV